MTSTLIHLSRVKTKIALAVDAIAPPKGWPQIGLLIAIWWGSDWLARITALPMPGSALGMVLLLLALLSGWVNPAWLRQGSASLLNHMLLFFIPAMMAPLGHRELFGLVGLKILGVIVVGTTIIMTTTALIVEFYYRLRLKTRGAEA
ncbi:CidA/LrgA family protein [Dongia soli]|uniref:CidA/LrgA family protein n=1 Tax=Dongia soli TaxID=600628 RepID=A0ABU5EB71_9PROT|nr:CidA/LrgA family protein [Dongia soli]MDY0883391.1 CidA/LrgA family protein [Dongia soli]